jgi:hypothetical protein
MSYFKDLMNVFKTKLPLDIKEIEWDGISFYMGGTNWNFNSQADWAIINTETMIIGCHDDDIKTFIKEQLLGSEIIDLLPSLDLPSYDPIFVLSNNLKIKFFSTSILEPWTLRIENSDMFVASPSDAEWVVKNF